MKKLLALLFICAPLVASAQQVPHPAPMSLPVSNVALKAINGGINLRAARLGFTTAGDGGYAEYNWSASNCTAADDGAQVQPSVTGCWIADFTNTEPTPKVWGAAGNGTTNDTTAVQAAVNARYRQTLYIGPYRYCIGSPGIVAIKPITIRGDTMGNRYQTPASDQYGFTSCTTNIELLKFSYDGGGGSNNAAGTVLRDLFIEAGSAGANTSGAAVVWNPTHNTRMENIRINRACIGVDIQHAHSLVMDGVDISSMTGDTQVPLGAGCGGIRVGHASTLADTADVRITNTTSNVQGDYGILVEDAGGLFIGPNVDILYAVNGTILRPSFANQYISWLYANSSALSDSTCSTGLIIDTTRNDQRITGLHFNQTWTSTAGNSGGCVGAGVAVQNTGGSTVNGVHFNGHRAYTNGADGFAIKDSVSNITIDNSEICANGTVYANVPTVRYSGIAIGTSVSGVAMRGNRIGGDCVVAGVWNGLQGIGINLFGSNSNITVVGNDLRGNFLTGIAATTLPTGGNVIRDNLGDDNTVPSVAAAATIVLPMGVNIGITGATTTISNLTGMWDGRTVNLYFANAGHTFAIGSGICNAKTVVQFEQVVAYRMPGTGCTYIK
jgi:hypothetical protein